MGSAAVDGASRSPKAIRVVAGVLGIVLALLFVPYTVYAMVAGDPEQTIHRFHNTAGSTSTLIVVAALFVLARRPRENPASMQLLIVAAVVSVVAGLLGGDLVHGLYFLPAVIVAILYALDPWKSDLRRVVSPRAGVLAVAVVVAIPAVAYGLTQTALQRHAFPNDVHAQMDHYSGVALSALAMPATLAVAALGVSGWRVVGWIGAAAFLVFGLSGLAYSTYMSAPDVGWSWASVFAGIATIVTVETRARRAATT